ncbi:MAG TPA: response regulator [Anaerolineae bacterium]|nr:response regulator [Anaerolineae bacterium]
MDVVKHVVRVLLVDADQDNYVLTRRLLAEARGVRFDLQWAETYEEGLEAMGRVPYHAHLVDYRLARGDALKLLLAAISSGCQAPIIVLTDPEDPGAAVAARQAGAADSLVKGRVSAELLQHSICRAIERNRLEDELRQTNKLVAVGRLTGAIAHDFNNLLTVINGCCDILLSKLWPDDPVRQEVEEIRQAGERAASLTQRLLASSRPQVSNLGLLDLNDVLLSMASTLALLLGEGIELQLELTQVLGNVRAHRGQIEQVVMNLAVNSREAMPSGGSLTIETINVELDDEYAGAHPGIATGPYVMLAVSDTGCGMTPEATDHLFEPFPTTEESGRGLGLATVHGIVQQSGGNLEVYGEPGRGTTVKIYLPRVDETEESPQDGDNVVVHTRGQETILVVEDQHQVRQLVARMLRGLGYTVLEAGRVEDVPRIFRTSGGAIDLVLADVVMPEMSGPALVAKLRELDQGFRVLYMSGYTDDMTRRHGAVGPEVTVVNKPFTVEKLGKVVREVLDGANGKGGKHGGMV